MAIDGKLLNPLGTWTWCPGWGIGLRYFLVSPTVTFLEFPGYVRLGLSFCLTAEECRPKLSAQCSCIANNRNSILLILAHVTSLVYVYSIRMPTPKKRHPNVHTFKDGNTSGKGNQLEKQTDLDKEQNTDKAVYVDNQINYQDAVKAGPKGELYVTNTYGQALGTMVLRPREVSGPIEVYNDDPSIPAGEENTNRTVHLGKLLSMINQANSYHREKASHCETSNFEYGVIEKWGFTCSVTLTCTSCGLTSPKYALFEEITPPKPTPGRKAAKINTGAALGTMLHGVSPAQMQGVSICMNQPSPTKRNALKLTEKVSEIMTQANQEDMKAQLERVQDINERKGLPRNADISLTSDERFNNPIYSGDGPSQGGTSGGHITSCDDLESKPMVHALFKTKKGPNPNVGENETVANEGAWLRETATAITENGGPNIAVFTTDHDSNAQAVAKEFGAISQECTTHLGRKVVKKKPPLDAFHKDMFPGIRIEKPKIHARFFKDLRRRCQAELNKAAEMYPGDKEAIQEAVKYLGPTIIYCYQGHHNMCKDHSLVCRPKKHMWRRQYLSAYKNPITQLICPTTANDWALLLGWLEYFFSDESVAKTYLRKTTNKVEAANRVQAKVLHRGVEYAKTAVGRFHGGVFWMNNRPFKATTRLLRVARLYVSRHSSVNGQLQAWDRTYRRNQQRQKDPRIKERAAKLKGERYARYDTHLASKCYYKASAPYKAQMQKKWSSDNQRKYTPKVDLGPAKVVTQRVSVKKDHAYA